jgi:hypothetical protein
MIDMYVTFKNMPAGNKLSFDNDALRMPLFTKGG